MAFSANPLSLSVPEPAFETWLRDTGYLEILDERATTSSIDPSPPHPSSSSPPSSSSGFLQSRSSATATATTTTTTSSSIFANTFSFFRTLISILTLNPFAKLTPDDFSGGGGGGGGGTPSWTVEFIGNAQSYSWPAGPSQSRMRVQENVRRYARNYASLALLFLACSLYQLPISLLGLISSLVLWELLRLCSDKWELEQRHPGPRQAFVRLAQFATAVILYCCNLQIALICATGVSYAVMILHASLRKLAPSKQSTRGIRHKQLQQKVQLTSK